MKEVKQTGGARIGFANASFPFAKLKVNEDLLELNVSLVGNLVFLPTDITSIEVYRPSTSLSRGIRINHTVPEYKEKVIFWTTSKPDELLKLIERTGFLENKNSKYTKDELILKRQKQGGFPVKKSAAIAVFVIWNVLFFYDFHQYSVKGINEFPIGVGIKLALGLVFLIGVLLLISESFRKIFLKEGRKIEDIKSIVFLLLFISGFMLLVFSLITF